MDQWLYSISDHCFDDLTNYRQNCYSLIVDGIIFPSDVKRCTLSYFASVSSSETMDRLGWQYGSKRLGMVYLTQHVRANQIEFATRSRWTSKNDILQMVIVFCFVQNFFFGQHENYNIYCYCRAKREFFFQNSTLGYMTNTLNHIYFYFLHQHQNIFFSNIGNKNIFLEKKNITPPTPPPPCKLNGRSLRQTAIQNAVTVESMVWNVLSLALNVEEIHVATCLHAKIRTLIQTNSWCLMLIFERYMYC
jgi:hypothetical protein